MIISVLQTKGGSGKSTLTQLLSFSSSVKKKFSEVSILELDIQGTLTDWVNRRKERLGVDDEKGFRFNSYYGKNIDLLNKDIKKIYSRNKNEIMFIDTGGESAVGIGTQHSISISDKVIIPIRISTSDETAFLHNLYPKIKDIKEKKFYLLPSFVHPSSNINNIRNYLKEKITRGTNLQIMKSCYFDRNIYQNYNRHGLSMKEYGEFFRTNQRETSRVEKATKDVETISKEMLKGL
jgi:cellulose biosynthesis protein BcsQ